MASEKPTMKVNIVAADRPIWSGTAYSVIIPASNGQMGILPEHEPVLTVIEHGSVRVKSTSGHQHVFTVTDGFAAFDSNSLTVAVDRCTDDEEPQDAADSGASAGSGDAEGAK